MTQPFVKWAGGKRQLLPAILSRLPTDIRTFYEPFVGGGAVFFALAREGAFDQARVNDLNEDLIQAYRTLADANGLVSVIALLKTYPYDRTFFEDIRRRVPRELSDAERTARFIYLNRAGFNGLYRVNRKGEFNVPFGKYTNPTICDESNLKAVHECLQQKVSFHLQDFEPFVESAQEGDAVYFDPPYLPVSDTANFTEYTEEGFGITEHRRLAATFRRLAERGVAVLLSNSDMPQIRALFEGFRIDTVAARRNINSDGDKRGPVSELLVGANLPSLDL